MKRANAAIYIDKHRPLKSGKCAVKIRLVYNRVRKYYPTGIYLTLKEYDQVMYAQRKKDREKEIYYELNSNLNKALSIINKLSYFNFENFEAQYNDNRNATESVSFAFDQYIKELKNEGRLKTASSYTSAKNSLENYKKNLTFVEVTAKFLENYEIFMLKNNKSITTVAIYLRSLKTIINLQDLPQELYPFGNSKNKYVIPHGRNIKKALTLEEMKKIYKYQPIPGSYEERARDYFLFLFYAGGMNVKDFCSLKRSDLDGTTLQYKRAKTVRTRKKEKIIRIPLDKNAIKIINKWGVKSLSKDAYIFPHLSIGISKQKEVNVVHNCVKQINKHMKAIAKKIGIDKEITTYYARHSFATILKRSGTKIEVISEMLGHSSVYVTESYLDSFEMKTLEQALSALTVGFDM